MRDSQAALHWIVQRLRNLNIPFAIVGGLAANAYGSTRPLNDIDIDAPDESLERVARELQLYVVSGPERYRDDTFDCLLLRLSYQEQDVELSGADTFRIKSAATGEWVDTPTNVHATEPHTLLGIEVPVMARDKLIAYKTLAGRDFDLLDVKAMSVR